MQFDKYVEQGRNRAIVEALTQNPSYLVATECTSLD